jgi:hypothetical protein
MGAFTLCNRVIVKANGYIGRLELGYGGLVCLVGLVITIWTYTSALNGGTYFVAWGAIIFGAIRFFRGGSDKEKYRAVLANIQAENEAEIINKIN